MWWMSGCLAGAFVSIRFDMPRLFRGRSGSQAAAAIGLSPRSGGLSDCRYADTNQTARNLIKQ